MAFLTRKSNNYVPTTFVRGAQYNPRADETYLETDRPVNKRNSSDKFDPISTLPGRDVEKTSRNVKFEGSEKSTTRPRASSGSSEKLPTRPRASSMPDDPNRLSKSGPKPKVNFNDNDRDVADIKFNNRLSDNDSDDQETHHNYDNSSSRTRTSKKGRCIMVGRVQYCKNGLNNWAPRKLALYENSLVLSKSGLRSKLIRTSTGLSETSGPSMLKKRMGKEILVSSIYKICYGNGDTVIITTSDDTTERYLKMSNADLAAEFVDTLRCYAPDAKLQTKTVGGFN